MENGTILLVEDSPDDVFFFRRALKKACITNPLQVAIDGQEALEYMSGTGKYFNRQEFPLPCLIFLDLKLPRLDGFEVLSWLRNQRAFPALPVVILASSSEERDRKRAAELAANAYLTKPPDENMVRQVILSAEKVKFELAGLGSETPLQALGSKSCRLT